MAKTTEAITPISRQTDAREVALAAYDALITLLDGLGPDAWSRPTECPGWTVADMVGHLIGAAQAGASKRAMMRQMIWGIRHRREFDGNTMDAFNALQVAEHRDLTPVQRVAALRALAPRAVAGRMATPSWLRRRAFGTDQTGSTAGFPESVTVGHLVDVVYTRDTWLHRVDIARATGCELPLGWVDGRIVEDVVAEWIGRHDQPVRLTLTGPAGGQFSHGDDGPEIALDAIEFCRVLSGRECGSGLLAWKVLF
jgi:uncharacterized protein (TIGR03083 family)